MTRTGERGAGGSGITDGMVLTTTDDPRLARVEAACRALAGDDERPPPLQDLAASVGVSPASLRRDFMAILGVTPKQYADQLRVERLRAGLRAGRDVTAAMYDAGYGSSSRLYEHSDSRLGMTPASYGRVREGRDDLVHHVRLPLRAHPRRRDRARHLPHPARPRPRGPRSDPRRRVRRRRHRARRRRASPTSSPRCCGASTATFPPRGLPLDVQGTAFQRRVWQELQCIPFGETRSYAEVAEAVGAPRRRRAVGSACGRNPVFVRRAVPPRHRVRRRPRRLRARSRRQAPPARQRSARLTAPARWVAQGSAVQANCWIGPPPPFGSRAFRSRLR